MQSKMLCVAGLMASVLMAQPAMCGESLIYTFQGKKDGFDPGGALIADNLGNLYGATFLGGKGKKRCGRSLCGTVFMITPAGKKTVLHFFEGGTDGSYPGGSLMMDSAGNLYGTTFEGGAGDSGTVFKLTPDRTESVLYAFQGESDGNYPLGALIADEAGNLYGITTEGGLYSGACSDLGCGTVFELQPDGTKITLYAFQGGTDGGMPGGGVIADSSGNLYGTAEIGGSCPYLPLQCGVVFEVAHGGTESVLYSFQGDNDGQWPLASLIMDQSGNFYGMTWVGGANGNGSGTVFKLTPQGTETILHVFTGGNDGESPRNSLVMDGAGNLYGTTPYGGGTSCRETGGLGCGTVYEVTPGGTEAVLYAFRGKSGGAEPSSPVILQNNALYGTTEFNRKPGCRPNGCGTVFEVTFGKN